MSSYSSLAQYYDKLTADVPYETFFNFYEEIFALYGLNIQTVLDLACGTGSLSALMANRGYEMICTDSSNDMLSVASEKTAHLVPRPILLNQEMKELDLFGTVDAAICSLDGINYVCPEDMIEVFRRILLFLEPGGIFIFDINTPYKLKSLDGDIFIDETEDLFCVWQAEFDDDENACFYDIDLFSEREGVWIRSREEHIEYSYEIDDLISKLDQLGFIDIQLFGELKLEMPAVDEKRIFMAARKPIDKLKGFTDE